MIYRIVSIRDENELAEEAIDYFASKWGIDRSEYEKSIYDCMNTSRELPRWYLMLDQRKRIIGSYGLIQNDFVDRIDLFPYLCALYIEKDIRGNSLGSVLLEHAKKEVGSLGFKKIYLCTDHIGYYEKYGWLYIGQGHHHWGDISRIYEADVCY